MKIEKGVPLPKRLSARVILGELPLKELRVGDSFLVNANTKKELEKKLNSLRMRLFRFSKNHPHFKFRYAQECSASGENQVRVWRVSRAG